MSQKIFVTSYRSVGCTFIDWSMHFLSGQSTYYQADLGQNIALSVDPLTKTNAHGHQKNQPKGFDQTKKITHQFDQQPKGTLCSAYAETLHLQTAITQLGLTLDDLGKPDQYAQVKKHIDNDYQNLVSWCSSQDRKLIFVALDPKLALYHQCARSLDKLIFQPTQIPTNELEAFKELQTVFFKQSQDQWQNLHLKNTWDLRECLALSIRPFHGLRYEVDLHMPHLWISCLNLWTRPVDVVENIMQYVNLPIVRSRFRQWLPICQRWQHMQLEIIEFCCNQPHIVEAIINNWHFDIDLTFQQEVLIQHFLIYQHGLNLKTWMLEKFPNNTKDLHQLLEPNKHQVPSIY